MKRWLARLSFTFMILAALLAWDAWRAARGTGRSLPPWQIILEAAGAIACIALAMIGVRFRHQGDQNPPGPGY